MFRSREEPGIKPDEGGTPLTALLGVGDAGRFVPSCMSGSIRLREPRVLVVRRSKKGADASRTLNAETLVPRGTFVPACGAFFFVPVTEHAHGEDGTFSVPGSHGGPEKG